MTAAHDPAAGRRELMRRLLEGEGVTDAGHHIPAHREQSPAPLSFPQRHLWLFEQTFPDTAAYNVPAVLRLTGRLSVPALRQAIGLTVERHSVLRARFVFTGDEPAQEVTPYVPVPVPMHDLSAVDDPERERRCQELIQHETAKPFDLSADPLLRAALIKLGDLEHLLVLCMHHIVGDAWSWGVFNGEVTTAYDVITRGGTPAAAPLSIQYSDFARWQRDRMDSAQIEAQLGYWQRQLAEAPPPLELPTDHPRPPVPVFRGATTTFTLPADAVTGLRRLGHQENATLFTVLLSVFDVLLYRYTGSTDILVGTSVASRSHEQVEPMIGFLVNTVVTRADLEPGQDFRALLRHVRDVCSQALANQDVPFEKVVERLRPARGVRSAPFFQVMLTLRPGLRPVPMAGLQAAEQPVHNATSKRDLTLTLIEHESTVTAQLEYDSALFEPSTVQRLAAHYQRLVTAVLAEPDLPVAYLPLLTDREQPVIDGSAARDRVVCLHEVFEAQAASTPQATAVRFEQDSLTYEELDQRANQLAHRLIDLGVGPEVRVGVSMDRSLQMIVAVLGVMKAGGAYVPVDSKDPVGRRHSILLDAGVGVVVHSPADGQWSEYPYQVVELNDSWSGIGQLSSGTCAGHVDPANTAYVLYTSGSTGSPKGVMVEHRQAATYVSAVMRRLGIGRDEPLSYAMVQPLTVDSCVTMLFPPLCSGGELHLIAPERTLDANRLADYFGRHPVDCLKIAPSHLKALLEADDPKGIATALLPRRRLVVGGEASSWPWLQEIQQRAGECEVHNHYGPTETTVGVLTFPISVQDGLRDGITPLGAPLDDVRVRVLDGHGQPVPAGVTGELHVAGGNLARGYLGRPDLTAAVFVPDPWAARPGDRLYRTGDMVRYNEDGTIHYIGRRDDQVKIRGFRIEPGEIEATLNGCPIVGQAVVVVRTDGEGEPQVVAYAVPTDDTTFDTATAMEFLRDRLPPHMLPAHLVRMDALPLSAHGKVDRQALPAPATGKPARPATAGPRSALERTIEEIWLRLLRVDTAGLDRNFFDLGGHSLLLIRLHRELQDAVGERFDLVELFRFTTVRAQAAFLSAAAAVPGALDQGRQRGRRQQELMRRRQQTRRTERGHDG